MAFLICFTYDSSRDIAESSVEMINLVIFQSPVTPILTLQKKASTLFKKLGGTSTAFLRLSVRCTAAEIVGEFWLAQTILSPTLKVFKKDEDCIISSRPHTPFVDVSKQVRQNF